MDTLQNMAKNCIRCGWCCQHIIIQIKRTTPLLKDKLQWYKDRGIKVQGNSLIIPSLCPMLYGVYSHRHGNWVTACKIHDTKNNICKNAICPKEKPRDDKT